MGILYCHPSSFLMMVILLVILLGALNNIIPSLVLICLIVVLPFAPTVLAIWEARRRDLISSKTRSEDLFTMIRVGFIAGIIGNAPLLLTFWAGALLGFQIFGFPGLLIISVLYIGVNSIGMPLRYYFG